MPLTCYRLLKTPSPTAEDFKSQAEKGRKPPKSLPAHKLAEWDGVSVLRSLEEAVVFQREFQYLGAYIAVLEIPDDAPVVRTPPDRYGHFTLRAPGAVLFEYLTDVISVDYEMP
jgi:hypothetical protein